MTSGRSLLSSAGAPSFNDNIAVRKLRSYTHRPAFCVMPPPSVMVIVIVAITDHDVISIANNHLRGNRNRANNDSGNGRI